MTVKVPFEVKPQEILGGGNWAEIAEMPGCVAQGETIEELEANLTQAALDWLQETSEKTEEEARQLAKLQGLDKPVGGPYPEPYPFLAPQGWSEDDD